DPLHQHRRIRLPDFDRGTRGDHPWWSWLHCRRRSWRGLSQPAARGDPLCSVAVRRCLDPVLQQVHLRNSRHRLRCRDRGIPALQTRRAGGIVARYPQILLQLAVGLLSSEMNKRTKHKGGMKMRTAIKLAAAILGATCLPIIALAEPGVSDTEIRIGDVNILTGPASFIGQAVSIGSRIAAA